MKSARPFKVKNADTRAAVGAIQLMSAYVNTNQPADGDLMFY